MGLVFDLSVRSGYHRVSREAVFGWNLQRGHCFRSEDLSVGDHRARGWSWDRSGPEKTLRVDQMPDLAEQDCRRGRLTADSEAGCPRRAITIIHRLRLGLLAQGGTRGSAIVGALGVAHLPEGR